MWAGGGTQDGWGRDGLPEGRLGPQKLRAGSAAGSEDWHRVQSAGFLAAAQAPEMLGLRPLELDQQ